MLNSPERHHRPTYVGEEREEGAQGGYDDIKTGAIITAGPDRHVRTMGPRHVSKRSESYYSNPNYTPIRYVYMTLSSLSSSSDDPRART